MIALRRLFAAGGPLTLPLRFVPATACGDPAGVSGSRSAELFRASPNSSLELAARLYDRRPPVYGTDVGFSGVFGYSGKFFQISLTPSSACAEVTW